jgi:glycosyltransferase involved in cell wall biosynthesis
MPGSKGLAALRPPDHRVPAGVGRSASLSVARDAVSSNGRGNRPPGRLLRVLYVVDLDPTSKFGSLEEQIVLLVEAFRDRGGLFLPVFSCPADGRGATVFQARGLPVVCLDLQRFRPASLRRLVGLIRRHQIDVVHWNFSPPLLNWYLWALTLLTPRVKHYFTDHNSRTAPACGPGGLWKRLVKRALLRRYQKVLAVSPYVLDCLRRERAWSNLSCCLHFINTDRFRPDAAVRAAVRKELGAEQRFVLLTVAQLIKAKGVDVVLRALAELPEPAALWVVGSGDEASRLEALSREMGLERRVRFFGQQGYVHPFMQAADCFVCPSRWAEAAGLVNIEAHACGLPVLASRVGGIPDYVADGRTGFLFPPGDHGELAERVRRLLADPRLCQDMGREARAVAVARFSAHARLSEYLDLYRFPGT